MQDEILFRAITISLFCLIMAVSAFFRSRANRQGGALQDPSSLRLVLVLRLVSLLVILPMLLYMVQPDWVRWAKMDLPIWLRWFGVVLACVCVPLLVWVFTSIGQNITPTHATRHGHRLVTEGLYRWIRHPLYSVGTLLCVALCLITSLWTLAVGMLFPLGILFWRVPLEEQRLIEQFGDEYRVYMQRTGRFLPKL
jgi:protein-S-isoprenylcysteine O-methyltransferase Ste14